MAEYEIIEYEYYEYTESSVQEVLPQVQSGAPPPAETQGSRAGTVPQGGEQVEYEYEYEYEYDDDENEEANGPQIPVSVEAPEVPKASSPPPSLPRVQQVQPSLVRRQSAVELFGGVHLSRPAVLTPPTPSPHDSARTLPEQPAPEKPPQTLEVTEEPRQESDIGRLFVLSSERGGRVADYRRMRLGSFLPSSPAPLASIISRCPSSRGMTIGVLTRRRSRRNGPSFTYRFEAEQSELQNIPSVFRKTIISAKMLSTPDGDDKSTFAIYEGDESNSKLSRPLAYLHCNKTSYLLAEPGEAPGSVDKDDVNACLRLRREYLGATVRSSTFLSQATMTVDVAIPELLPSLTYSVRRPASCESSLSAFSEKLEGGTHMDKLSEVPEFRNVIGLTTHLPAYDSKNGNTMPFYQRASVASSHNVQIRSLTTPTELILLLGKRSKNDYSLDFRAPLCLLQAFALAIAIAIE